MTTISNPHARRFRLFASVTLAALLGGACRDDIGGNGATPPPPPAASAIVWERSAGIPAAPIAAVQSTSFGIVLASLESGPIYRSSDAGATWQIVVDRAGGITRAIASAGMTIVAASSVDGTLRSSDNGVHWSSADSGMTDRAILSVAALSGGHFLAGSESGTIYRSTDGGESWSAAAHIARTIVAIAPGAAGAALISAWDHGVYRFIESTSALEPGDAGMNHPYVAALAVGGSGDSFAGTYPNGIFRSSTGGVSWLPMTNAPPAEVRALLAHAGTTVLAGTTTGVLVSFDRGLHWSSADSGLGALDVASLAATPSGRYIAGTSAGVFFSMTAGTAAPTPTTSRKQP